ncbi:hypothetical protein [Halorussus sp. MSC15.2]|uniref:hypothetical protein n=1 Tax=Halorussus sp. MSC15.2 TaxID=2283638 RepID=UPI0013D81780|nr:hypothetical protein [Halorussus sp. MSC15.2]NEU56435.1 hypothetical protein [Halorussus sp. MSC15.2]
MPPSRRRPDGSPNSAARRSPRRRVLRLGAVALAGSLAGCASGLLREEADETPVESTESTAEPRETTGEPHETGTDAPESRTSDEPTTHPVGVDTSLPEGSVEFPDGPKSRPERPAVPTAESVDAYVETFERRYVYNQLSRDESTAVSVECGVDSVAAYGDGFRVVAWCSASASTGEGATTLHADYFTQYATYFVGPNSTVRRDGRSEARE